MARYVDADGLLKNLKKQYGEELGWQCTVNMSDVGMMIEDAPTADVVPRSDIESIFTFAETALTDAKNVCERNFAKAAQGGMADIEKAIGRKEQTELFERMLKRYKELYFAGRERKEQP